MPPTEDRCSVMPVLIQRTQDTPCHAPYWRQVFSDACFDSAYAGHHLLCPLLKTGVQWCLFDSTYAGHPLLCPLLATRSAGWRSQTEWGSPSESRRPLRPSTTNTAMWTLWPCGLWSGLPQASKEAGTPRLRSAWEHGWKVTSVAFMQWCLFWFSIHRTPPIIPPTDDMCLSDACNTPMWTLWSCGLWLELHQAKKEAGTPRLRSPREQHAGRATEAETVAFFKNSF